MEPITSSTVPVDDVIGSFHDTRIHYMRLEKSQGVAAARNVGLKHSQGKYIAFLDDDDSWLPPKLAKQVGLLDRSPSDYGCLYSGRRNIDPGNGKVLSLRPAEKRGDLLGEVLTYNRITTSSVLVKRACIEKVGLFDEWLHCCSDQDMWIRLSQEYRWECIPDALVNYGIHQNRLTSSLIWKIKARERLMEKYARLLAFHTKGYSWNYLDLGIMYCLTGDTRKGRSAYVKSITLSPFQMKAYLGLCLSLLGSKVFKKWIESRNQGGLRLPADCLSPDSMRFPWSMSFWKTLIGFWRKAFLGDSYWHGAIGAGPSFRPGELRDYYRDYSPKVHWSGAMDELQLPLVQEPGGTPFSHPVVLAQKALGHWSCWLKNLENREKHYASFLQLAQWLVRSQESQGSWDIPIMHKPVFTVPYSALVQGQAISVLVRACSITSDEMYLEAARRGLAFMLKPIEQGGLCRITPAGPILEEYPCYQPRTVLNGWISALYGVYDLLLLNEDAEARKALDASLGALITNLPKYDAGYWSLYDTSGTIASPYYHQVHITQLKALELTFPQQAAVLRTVRTSFEEQGSSSMCCTKAFVLKVIQKFKQPPPFLFTQTVKPH